MRRMLRPLIGKVPCDILNKYNDELCERISDYALTQSHGLAFSTFLWGLIIGCIIGAIIW